MYWDAKMQKEKKKMEKGKKKVNNKGNLIETDSQTNKFH